MLLPGGCLRHCSGAECLMCLVAAALPVVDLGVAVMLRGTCLAVPAPAPAVLQVPVQLPVLYLLLLLLLPAPLEAVSHGPSGLTLAALCLHNGNTVSTTFAA